MSSAETLRKQVRARLLDRDLRYFGLDPWDKSDGYALSQQVENDPPEHSDTIADMYLVAIESMDEQGLQNVLFGLRRCPPRHASLPVREEA